MLSIGAGTGLLYLLRWFWWRINAWSEIAAMVSSFVLAVALFFGARGRVIPAHVSLIATVAVTTIVWLAARADASRPTARRCARFYNLARPAGRAGRTCAASAAIWRRRMISRASSAGSRAASSSSARSSAPATC